ncbi:MAG: helix-turn-helix transcriptional regulator [Clostridiales bacterium]|nr:helix-turn-helix transcriptional regulator [Clostridiales bacterium]
MADFTSRFNELLTRHEGNDTDLGIALGVSKQTISAWRTGTRSPKKPHIVAIAKYFNVGIPWLMGISDYETENVFDTLRRSFGPDAPASQLLHRIGEQLSPYSSDYDPCCADLMKIYDGLNDRGRADLLKYARYLSSDPDMTQDGASNTTTA